MKIDNTKLKSAIINTLIVLGLTGILFGAFLYATSAEVWWAGEHDSQCEGCDEENGKSCGCYERFLERDRQEAEKLRKK